MIKPQLSSHFQTRAPSAIRLTQIEFLKRTDQVTAINIAIGNVSLPMHPAMVQRMFSLDAPNSPFLKGIVKYSTTVGEIEANQAILHLIECSGFSKPPLVACWRGDPVAPVYEKEWDPHLFRLVADGAAPCREHPPTLLFLLCGFTAANQPVQVALAVLWEHQRSDGRFIATEPHRRRNRPPMPPAGIEVPLVSG